MSRGIGANANKIIEKLKIEAETDDNRVVRIHCLGAIKASLENRYVLG